MERHAAIVAAFRGTYETCACTLLEIREERTGRLECAQCSTVFVVRTPAETP